VVSNLVGLLVSDRNYGSDTTSRSPMAFQGYASWVHDGDKIVEYAIGDVFVKDPFIAKLLQVKLQAFQLDTFLIRHVSEDKRSEIGLAGLGAHRRKLGTFDLDMVVTIGKGIVETLELILKRRAWHSWLSWG